MKTRIFLFLILGIFVTPSLCVLAEIQTNVGETTNFIQDGKDYFSQGNFEEALAQWQKAEKTGLAPRDQAHKYELDMLQGEAFRRIGQYQEATKYFKKVLEKATDDSDAFFMTQALDKLGAMAFELGDGVKGLEVIDEGLRLARENGQASSLAGLLNTRGNILTSMGRNNGALGAYTEAATLAGKNDNSELELIALINSAKAASQAGLLENSEDRLDLALEKIDSFSNSHDKVNGLLTVGIFYSTLDTQKSTPSEEKSAHDELAVASHKGQRGVRVTPGGGPQELEEVVVTPDSEFSWPSLSSTGKTPSSPEKIEQAANKSLRLRAFAALDKAKNVAQQIGDHRGEAYALGHLGHLYEENRQYEDALTLTRQAVVRSQKAVATESLFQWHWQTARILRAKGELDDASQAYRRAIASLQPIRNEVSIAYQAKNANFRDGVGRMYFELADVLLTRAKGISGQDTGPEYLIEARNTIEGFKAAELQDYFQEDCVQPSQTLTQTLTTISPNTAILYPILLKDRIELIANFPGGLKQYTVRVSEEELTNVARQFRLQLQDTANGGFQESANQLYNWLIKPVEKDLEGENIQTLVFVPDGALRSIPIAALSDGEQYLIEKYATAVTPGVTLTDPKPLNRENINILSLGITDAVQGFPALPYVGKELEALQGMYKGKRLLNEDFVVSNMRQQLKNEDYNIVHIASHGLVESNVENTFVLAHDEKITMDRLAELVGLFRFRKAPLELLTLSACETAAGDDRAALGLAGVAVKAGARSALATLWFIDDVVASDLVQEFYQQLKNPALSKARALQLAQMKILEDSEYRHPNFWSPFLLINNWL